MYFDLLCFQDLLKKFPRVSFFAPIYFHFLELRGRLDPETKLEFFEREKAVRPDLGKNLLAWAIFCTVGQHFTNV